MDIGLIGLAVMGQNLVLNMERNGYSVAVYNRTGSKTDEFVKNKGTGKNIIPSYKLKEFCTLLNKPRKIIIMVKAGKAVDDLLEELTPLLDKGDIIIDGGNSHYTDTRRRSSELEKKGFLFLGTGISGGEEGALKGPCIMPGGSEKAYNSIKDILLSISAKVDNMPCCTYIGREDAGHFVKMVHNGIEYGDMQIIGEAYDFLRHGLNMAVEEIKELFLSWKDGELSSYLMDITSEILDCKDEETGSYIIDLILDKAGQKGTGRWTSQAALDLGVPLSVIDMAVFSRNISALKSERVRASSVLRGPVKNISPDKNRILQSVHDSMLCAKITSYAQGMAFLHNASLEFNYNLKLHEIAQIWKGGCIIRAGLLEPIKQAFLNNNNLENLYLDDYFNRILNEKQNNWRFLVIQSIEYGIPCPVTSSALQYYDSYRAERLPANLVQAQRDYFGAHTYERIDRNGVFHTDWLQMR